MADREEILSKELARIDGEIAKCERLIALSLTPEWKAVEDDFAADRDHAILLVTMETDPNKLLRAAGVLAGMTMISRGVANAEVSVERLMKEREKKLEDIRGEVGRKSLHVNGGRGGKR